jgi:hypothetical protein
VPAPGRAPGAVAGPAPVGAAQQGVAGAAPGLHHHGMVQSPVDPADPQVRADPADPQVRADPADPQVRADADPQARAGTGTGEGFAVPERQRTEDLERELSRELRPHRVVPRWVGWAMIAGGVLMLPWVAGLAVVLPERKEAAHYSAAWVGFDLVLCAVLLRTGWLAQRGREHIELSAAMTGTLLLVDAWFDVVTANGRNDLLLALALAVFAEVPIAAFCLWIAGRVEYRRQERARTMGEIVRRLRHRRRFRRHDPAGTGGQGP